MKKRHVVHNIAMMFFFCLLIIAAHRWFKLAALAPFMFMGWECNENKEDKDNS